jgi:N-acetylglucosamine-6-phosphate deacetylase
MKNTNGYLIQGDLLWPDGRIRSGRLVVSGSKITAVEPQGEAEAGAGGEIITVPDGGIVAPGFIDLQIHGAFGHDFTMTPRQITAVARNLPRYGVTSFLPTLVSAPLEQYTAAAAAVRALRPEPEMATVLGLHLEGPYLNRARAGAHPVHLLRQPELEEMVYFDPAVVRLMTVSPELPRVTSLIRALRQRDIVVGLGHSEASYEETVAAIEAGATWAAHIFNSMGPLHHRYPGIVGALLASDQIRLALMADGIHLHPAILRFVAAAKGAQAITLTSNAVAACGMPDGRYSFGAQTVIADGGTVRLPNGSLVGTMEMQDHMVRNMVKLAGQPVAKVLQMASQTPAEALALSNKGRLAPGRDADLVVLDRSLQVHLTMIQGQIAYRHTT